MAAGYHQIGCDAFNVGSFDIAGGYQFLKSIMDTTNLPFLSANLIRTSDNKLAFEAFRTVEKDGFRIGITGVTTKQPGAESGLAIQPYEAAGIEVINELKPDHDFIIMMVNAGQDEIDRVHQVFSGADFILLSGSIQRTKPVEVQTTGEPLEYSSGKQGKYLTVIDLTIANPDSPLVDVSGATQQINTLSRRLESLQKRDPNLTLEEIFANNTTMLKLIGDYRIQLNEAETTLANARNRCEYQSVPMGPRIKDEPEILAMVNSTLFEYANLKKSNQPQVNMPVKSNRSPRKQK